MISYFFSELKPGMDVLAFSKIRQDSHLERKNSEKDGPLLDDHNKGTSIGLTPAK